MKQREEAHVVRLNGVDKDVKKRTFLSEQDIISLQTIFVSPGFHCVTVPTIEMGRSILETLLESLNHYAQPALLSKAPVPDDYLDLYQDLIMSNTLVDPGQLEQFMASSFYYDFLAIEGTKELLQDAWFGKFEQLLIDYEIPQSLPIVMFLYR